MSRADFTKNLSDYTAFYKTANWSANLDDWMAEIEQTNEDNVKKIIVTHKPLSIV